MNGTPKPSPYARNVIKHSLYIAFHQLSIWMVAATWVIYLQQRRGLGVAQVTSIDAIFWLSMALGELPTGVVADLFGRKLSLILGEVLSCAGMLLYGLAPTFALLIVANVIWALALTFHSGAGEALLYESLRASGRGHEYPKTTGRAVAVSRGTSALGSAVAGLLAAVDLLIPFLAAALLSVAALGVALTLREPRSSGAHRASGASEAQPGHRAYGLIVRRALAAMRDHPPVRFSVLYLTIVPLAGLMISATFLQPHAVSLGVPVSAVGVLVMAANGASMLGALAASWLGERIGRQRLIYVVPAGIVLCLAALGASRTALSLTFAVAISFVTDVARPQVVALIQDAVPDQIRATVSSLRSLAFTFVLAVSEPVLGALADRFGLPAAYLGLAGLIGVFCAALFWVGRTWLASEPPIETAEAVPSGETYPAAA